MKNWFQYYFYQNKKLKGRVLKKARHRRVYTIGFHLYKVQKQSKAIFGVRSQDSSYPTGGGWLEGRMGSFEGCGNVLSLDLDSSFFFFWPHCAACGILVLQESNRSPPALEGQNLNYWTTREWSPWSGFWLYRCVQFMKIQQSVHLRIWTFLYVCYASIKSITKVN